MSHHRRRIATPRPEDAARRPDRANLRASQVERDRVVDKLRVHAGEGRLEIEELEQRVGAALAARTHGELASLLADLPRSPSRRPRGHLPRGDAFRTYVLVMALLIVIWAATGAAYFWPMWPMLGWGIGLVGGPNCRRASARRRPVSPI